MARIIVVEPVAAAGVEKLSSAHETAVRTGLARDELLSLLSAKPGWDALVVRSQTRVDAELLDAASPRLSCIGVASVGTDRIDIDAATRAGVMVVNAPTGNTIAAAEHTMALMLSLLRHIPSADASVRRGSWEREAFVGRELRGRTLGIIGLGKIGKAVARRASAFDARVLAHDPFLTPEQAADAAAELVSLADLLARSDIVSVHAPLTDSTRGMIGPAQLDAVRPGSFVLNVARGGIVDEVALANGLRSGHLAGAAVDVYSIEPLARDNPLQTAPNVILTPHLGASTSEAQERVGVEMADQLLLALAGLTPPYAVNAPTVAPETAPRLLPFVDVGYRLALLARQLHPHAISDVALTYGGEIAAWECGPIRTAVLAGLLEAVTEQRVNAVNADLVARERGVRVSEGRSDGSAPWASLVTVDAGAPGGDRIRLAGTTAHGRPQLAELDDFTIDAELSGRILVTRHQDQPGIVGAVGTALADAGINISSLELSRLSAAGDAIMFVSVDDEVPNGVLDRLGLVEGVDTVTVIQLGPTPDRSSGAYIYSS
jgi:D-3-phosphoglycerate dehydrogenase / 2-oxoglutarate reductase